MKLSARQNLVRVAVTLAIVAAASLLGMGVYYSRQTEHLLTIALNLVPTRPREAFDRFSPVLLYNDILTLGAVSNATDAFRSELVNVTLNRLQFDPITQTTYFSAAEAIEVLGEIERRMGINLGTDKLHILKAVRASADRVLERGTILAWDRLKMFFTDPRVTKNSEPEILIPYLRWLETLKDVPRTPLAMREALYGSSEALRIALERLNLKPSDPDGPLVQPMPPDIPEMALYEAERALANSIDQINNLKRDLEEIHSTELQMVLGKLNYNIATLRLALRLQVGGELPQLGSEYMVKVSIGPEYQEFPPNEVLYQAFMHECRTVFYARALHTIQGVKDYPDTGLQHGLATLTAYSAAWAAWLDDPSLPHPSSVLQSEDARLTTGPQGRKILDSLKAPTGALLIVRIP
jgi:hypothetical protein